MAAPSSEFARHSARALVAVILLLAGCALQSATQDPLDHLFNLIDRRLELADAVARSKWNSGAAVEDLAREREIVDAIGKQAPGYGLEPAAAAAFFQAQIEASKIVQNVRLTEWRAAALPPFATVPDLQRDIRPQLDKLTVELLDALARAQPVLRTPQAAARLKERATDTARAAALAPLRERAAAN